MSALEAASALLAPEPGCAIVSVESVEEVATDGARNVRTDAVIASENGNCRAVAITLPWSVDLLEVRAKLHLSDDTVRKLPDSRLVFGTSPGTLDRFARVVVPELLKRDEIRLSFTTSWLDDASPSPRTPGPPGPVTVTRSMQFAIPEGDVQTSLYPGGAASARVQVDLGIAPSADGSAVLAYAIPRDALDVTATATVGTPTVLRPVHGAVLIAGATGVSIAYTLPDPPACGEERPAPGETLVAWSVDDPDGNVVTEDAFWTLVSHGTQPVIPGRAAIAAGLQYRFDRLALPEPALPLALKRQPRDLELLSKLRDALWSRARVAQLPGDPLFPRKLYAARKSEVVTPIEAALIIRLYAMQAGFPADVVLVRPADQGEGDEVCPVGHHEALVRTWFGDDEKWIDPGCPSCAPFEVRPVLLGASAYSERLLETPDPVPGVWAAKVDGTRASVHLEGPQALLLRQALEDVAPDAREAAIASYVGGDGAVFGTITGLADAGAPIDVTVDGVTAGSLGPSWRLTQDDTWFTDAPGTFSIDRATTDETPADVTIGGMHYTRTVADGRAVETLTVTSRTASAADLAALAAARAAR